MLVLLAALSLAPTFQDFDPIAPITQELETVSSPITGDFNGDGQTDIILLGRSNPKALLLLGDGSGGFADEVAFETGLNGAFFGSTGDLNGDGVLDLALYGGSGDQVRGRTLLGVGDGSFAAPNPLTFSSDSGVVRRLRVVDLDGDGDLDIVTVGSGVEALQNLGGGVFAPTQTFGLNDSHDVAILDVDGDGDLDLMRTTYSSLGLIIEEQTSPWQFEGTIAIPLFSNIDRFEVADLDADGDQDLMMDRLLVENLGAGTFAVAATLTPTNGLVDFRIGDVNLDGRPDVIGISNGTTTTTWFENAGAFVFNQFDLPNAAEPASKALNLADFNGDGADDLLLTRNDGAVDLLISDLSLGSVPYGTESSPIHEVTPELESLVAADLDGDGDAEIIAATERDGIYRLRNIGFQSYESIEQLVTPTPGGFIGTRTLEATDLDGDGHMDLLCVGTQGGVTWLEGDGNGVLTPRTLNASGPLTRGEAYAADVDGDGDLDVLVASAASSVLLIEQSAPGVFAPPAPVVSVQGTLVEIRLARLNGDDDVDIALFTRAPQASSLSPMALRSSIGNGDGTFQAPALLLGGLESVGQIETMENATGAPNSRIIWNRLNGPSFDEAYAGFGTQYVFRPDAVSLAKRAEGFALGSLLPFDAFNLVVQEGAGSTANPANLTVYGVLSLVTPFLRRDVVADGLIGTRSVHIADLNGDIVNDILVLSDAAPRISWLRNRRQDLTDVRYCSPAVPNMTGEPARISVFRGQGAFFNTYVLQANDLPTSATTLFLTSKVQGFQPVVPGSIGTLCLGGAIGRFVGPGQIQTSSADGAVRLEASRSMTPQPGGFESAAAGSLWFYQAWYRDSQGGAAVSNFTDAVALRF